MAAVELASTSLFSDANLVSYYKMEDATDTIGGHTLANSNSVTFVAGKFNNAGSFVATSSQTLGTANGAQYFAGTSDKAFSLWFAPSAQPASGEKRTIMNWGNGTHNFYFRYVNVGGTTRLEIGDGNVEKQYDQTFNTDTFYNLIVSYTAVGTLVNTYINGALLGTHNTNITAPNNTLSIGQLASVGSFFNGRVDDVALFSRQLNLTDVNIINGIGGHTLSTSSKYW